SSGSARLNDWLRGCAPRNATPLPAPPDEIRGLFSEAQWALMNGDQFRQRDTAHLRDCLVFQSFANRVRQSAPDNATESQLVRHAFQLLNFNLQLEAKHQADLSMSAYDICLMGRGTAADRAWIFVNTLRALGVDALVLTPRNDPEADDAATGPLLVGTVRDKELDLFDPARGIPLPGPASGPEGLVPATLRQLIADPSLAPPTEEGAPKTDWTQPRGWLVGDLGYYSQLSHRLQAVFGGEQATFLSDPLQDLPGRPGLVRRLLDATDGVLTIQSLALWPYSSEQVAQSLALNEAQQGLRKAQRLRFMAYLVVVPDPANPGGVRLEGNRQYRDPASRGMDSRDDSVDQRLQRTATRVTSGRQLEARMLHLAGDWKEAVSAYVEVQSNSQDVLRFRRERIDVDLGGGPIDIKLFHTLAVDDAAYWIAVCQWEQGQVKAAQSTVERYLRQARPGSQWTRSARWLLAELLATQGRQAEAAEVLSQLPEGLDSSGAQAQIRAWTPSR
ncbi:MAG: tetratricopeptide repeat protein, partial [Planctomycetaceae bacterium]